MTLKFNANSHRYWIDGRPVTGVTTLMKGGLPKPALMYWSAKSVAEFVADNPEQVKAMWEEDNRRKTVEALKGVPWDKRDEAAARGTEVHALAADVVHGIEVVVPPHINGHVEGYASWLDRFAVAPVLTECSVGNRKHWYAGRFDLIADFGGYRWMLDVKTSKGVYSDTAIQTDAYRNSEFYVTDDDPDTELPMPEGIERLGVLHVTEDGTTLYPLQSDGEPFRDFLHIAWISKRSKVIDSYLKEPIYELTDLEIPA